MFAGLPSRLCPAASGNEWQKDRQFHALNAEAELVEVKALRGGRECLVTNTDVVVGDVLLVDTGDRVVADGIVVEAHGLTIDEARVLTLPHTLCHGFWRHSPWVPWSTALLLMRPDRQLMRGRPQQGPCCTSAKWHRRLQQGPAWVSFAGCNASQTPAWAHYDPVWAQPQTFRLASLYCMTVIAAGTAYAVISLAFKKYRHDRHVEPGSSVTAWAHSVLSKQSQGAGLRVRASFVQRSPGRYQLCLPARVMVQVC